MTGKNSKFFAKIYFKLNKKDKSTSQQAAAKEMPYIFEKLTGVPRELYAGSNNLYPEGKIESEAKIKVTGTPEAIKLLSPGNPSEK